MATEKYQSWQGRLRGPWTHGTKGALEGPALAFARFYDIADRFFTEVEQEIIPNPNLTEKGKADAKLGLYQDKYEEKFGHTLPTLEGLQEKVRKLRTTTNTPVAPREPEDAAGVFQDVEIRGWLRGLQPRERTDIVRHAMTEGDERILGSVLRAPKELSGVGDGLYPLVRDAVSQGRFSKEAEQLKVLEPALQDLEKAYENTVGAIEDFVGLTKGPRRGVLLPAPPPTIVSAAS